MIPQYDSEYLKMLKEDPKIVLTIRELSEIILSDREENKNIDFQKAALLKALLALEWLFEPSIGGPHKYCPVCENRQESGHLEDCAVRHVLKEAKTENHDISSPRTEEECGCTCHDDDPCEGCGCGR